jgi:hypothetical protein
MFLHDIFLLGVALPLKSTTKARLEEARMQI